MAGECFCESTSVDDSSSSSSSELVSVHLIPNFTGVSCRNLESRSDCREALVRCGGISYLGIPLKNHAPV